MNRTVLLAAVAAMFAAGSCTAGSHNVNLSDAPHEIDASSTMASRTETVGDFHEIEASRVKVVYSQGPVSAVRIDAPDNVLPHVRVAVNGGTLRAEIDRGYNVNFHDTPGVTVTVSSPALDEVSATLAGRVVIDSLSVSGDVEFDATTSAVITVGALRARDVEVKTTTAASVSITALYADEFEGGATTAGSISVTSLTADEVAARTTTASTITLAGTARSVDFGATTGGNVNASDLVAATGEAAATTGGSVNCHVATLTSRSETTGGSVTNR